MVDDSDSRDAARDATEDARDDAVRATEQGARGGGERTDGPRASSGERSESDGGVRSREVVVPLRLYKTVTVFSTLIAVGAVVLGFVVLDAATQRATLEVSEIDPLLAAVGVGLIAAGGLVYAFASRFRAEGMRKDKDASDEDSGNG